MMLNCQFLGTATDELDSAVSEYRRGHSYKSSRGGTIHSELGLVSMFMELIV